MKNTVLSEYEEIILTKIVNEWIVSEAETSKNIFGMDVVNIHILPLKEKLGYMFNHNLI